MIAITSQSNNQIGILRVIGFYPQGWRPANDHLTALFYALKNWWSLLVKVIGVRDTLPTLLTALLDQGAPVRPLRSAVLLCSVTRRPTGR